LISRLLPPHSSVYLALHDALPIYKGSDIHFEAEINAEATVSSITLSIHAHDLTPGDGEVDWDFEQTFTDSKYLVINPVFHEHIEDRKSTRLNSSHVKISYAVFCLK